MLKLRELESDGRRWFEVAKSDLEQFEVGDQYALTVEGKILDADGVPMTPGDASTIAVSKAIAI